MAVRIVEPDADPGADQGQAPLVELRAQLVGIGGHEAPVPELGARVARRVHLVDDAAIAVPFPIDALDDAPGARGVRDPDPVAHHRSPRIRQAGRRPGWLAASGCAPWAGATTFGAGPVDSRSMSDHRQADRLGRLGEVRVVERSGEPLDGEPAHLGLLLGDRREARATTHDAAAMSSQPMTLTSPGTRRPASRGARA